MNFWRRNIHAILFFRAIVITEKEKIEQKVISAYTDLELFLKDDKYDQDLRNELEKSHPNYLDVIKKWRNDMENSDHGIIISGTYKLIGF